MNLDDGRYVKRGLWILTFALILGHAYTGWNSRQKAVGAGDPVMK
jgi:hypothetical protein